MKMIKCKNCNKFFAVANVDYRTGGPSDAEKSGLCGDCNKETF